MKRKDGATQQVKIFSRYTVLIDKARFWIQQGKDRAGKKKIQDAVILHIVQDFHERVERDIQLINDYLTHAIDGIDAAIEVKNELRAQLMPMLSPSLLRLYQLRESNEEPSLESLVLWRSKADNSRENLFSSSLHTIDTFFKDFLPTPSKEKESEYMLALLMQLVNLEEKIMGVSDLVNYDVLDNTQRGVTSDMLEKLEQEAHELNRNLRLSDEHGDRVQQSLHIITSLRKKIC